MRKFLSNTYVRNLGYDDLQIIDQETDDGIPEACFKQALVYISHKDIPNWNREAHKLLLKAKAGGVIDAEAVIADMIRYGELDNFDFSRAKKLLDKSRVPYSKVVYPD